MGRHREVRRPPDHGPSVGTVTTAENVELQVVSEQAPLLQVGQGASIELRPGITATGKVIRIDSGK